MASYAGLDAFHPAAVTRDTFGSLPTSLRRVLFILSPPCLFSLSVAVPVPVHVRLADGSFPASSNCVLPSLVRSAVCSASHRCAGIRVDLYCCVVFESEPHRGDQLGGRVTRRPCVRTEISGRPAGNTQLRPPLLLCLPVRLRRHVLTGESLLHGAARCHERRLHHVLRGRRTLLLRVLAGESLLPRGSSPRATPRLAMLPPPRPAGTTSPPPPRPRRREPPPARPRCHGSLATPPPPCPAGTRACTKSDTEKKTRSVPHRRATTTKEAEAFFYWKGYIAITRK